VVGLHVYNTGPFYKYHHWVENYNDGAGNPVPWRLAMTNYLGVCGAGRGTSPWWGQWEGVYTNRSKIRLSQIDDGTSQTFLYGEAAGRATVDPLTNQVNRDALTVSWFGVGVIPSANNLEPAHKARWNQFSSYHTTGVRFAFADGSVRNVSYTVTAPVLLQLSGRRDGVKVAEMP
jgi:hypothetical protein